MARVALLVLAIFLTGCARGSGTVRATAEPTTKATTQVVFRAVDLHYSIYLARIDVHTTITSGGFLRCVRTDCKSWGPGDIDPRNERVEVREGQLTREQISELAGPFRDWDLLSSDMYPSVPDGGETAIRYGDKLVSGGDGHGAPKQMWEAHRLICDLAAAMPVVKH